MPVTRPTQFCWGGAGEWGRAEREGHDSCLRFPLACSLPGCSEVAPPAENNQRQSAGKALLATGWRLSLLPEGSRCSETSSC